MSIRAVQNRGNASDVKNAINLALHLRQESKLEVPFSDRSGK